MAFERRLKVVLDTTQPLQASRELQPALQGLVGQSQSLSEAARTVTESMRQWSTQASSVVQAEREKAQALSATLQALRQGPSAVAALAAAEERKATLTRAGTEADTAQGQAILALITAQERYATQIEAVTAAQAAEVAGAEKLAAVLSSLASKTAATGAQSAAESQGPAAVAALNAELQARNALLEAGVALEDAQGQLVITSEAGAAAVRSQVGALQAEEAALAEVRAQQEALASEGAAGGGMLAGAFESVGQAIKTMVVYGGLIILAQQIKEAVSGAVEFEDSMTRLKTLVGVQASEVDSYRESISRISVATGQSADDEAKAMFAITSAGVRGKQALDALQASAEASALGMGDQTTVARAAVAAMTAYGAQNLSARDAIDVMIATAREGNTTVDQMAGSFGRVIGIAATVGVKFGDVGAAIASMTRLGVSADEAVTGLRGTLAALDLKEAKSADAALKTVGTSVQGLRQEIKEKGLAQALVDLVSKFDGNNDALAKVIPNIRALSEVLSNAKSQAGEYVAIQDRVNASIGHALTDASALNASNPALVFRQMSAAIDEAGRALVSGFLPAMVDLAKSIKETASSGDLRAWSEAAAQHLDLLVHAAKAYVEIQIAFAVASTATELVKLAAAGDLAKGSILGLNTAMLASPFGAVVVGLALVYEGLSAGIDQMNKANAVTLTGTEIALQQAGQLTSTWAGLKASAHETMISASNDLAKLLPQFTGQSVTADNASAALRAYEKASSAAGQSAKDAKKLHEDVAKALDQVRTSAEAAALALQREAVASLQNLNSMGNQLAAARRSLEEEIDRAKAAAGANVGSDPDAIAAPQTQMFVSPAFSKFLPDLAGQNVEISEAEKGLADLKIQQDQVGRSIASLSPVFRQATDDIKKYSEGQKDAAATAPGLTTAQKKASESIKDQILVMQAKASAAQKEAAAALLGPAALKKERDEQAANIEVDRLALKEKEKKLPVDQKLLDDAREAIEGLRVGNDLIGQNSALYAGSVQVRQSFIEAEAKIADARNGNSFASERAASAFAAEQEIQAKVVAGEVVAAQTIRDDASARTENAIASQIRAKAITDERAAQDALATSHAGFADALTRTSDASEKEVIWQKERNAAMAAGVSVFEFMLTAQGKKIAADQQELTLTEKLTNAQKALDSVKSQVELATAMGGISTALPATEQEAEKQFLTFIQNIGAGSLTEGQKLFSQWAAKAGDTTGDLTRRLLGYYQSLSDASVEAQIAGASKSPFQVYQEKQDQLTRIAVDNADKNIALANDANATMAHNSEQFWAGQVTTWKTAVDNLAKIGGKVGDILGAIGTALGAIQQAQTTGASLSAAVSASKIGGADNSSIAASAGVVGMVVSIFTSIYDGLEAHINKLASETYGTGNSSVNIIKGDIGVSYLDNQGQKVVDEIKKVVKSFGDALGGSITDLDAIGVQIRNDGKYVASYVKDHFIGHFASVDEAIQAALEYELQTGAVKIKGLSDLVVQGIKSFTESDFAAEEEWLKQLKQISDLSNTQGGLAVDQAVASMNDLWAALAKLPTATAAVVQGFADIGNNIVASFQTWRNSVTGDAESPQQKLAAMQAEGWLFNAKKQLEEANLQVEIADLQAQAANTTTRGRLVRINEDISQADLDIMHGYLVARAAGVQAAATLTSAEESIVQVQIDAANAVLAALKAMPDIDISSLHLPRTTGGGTNPQQTALDLLTQHRHDMMGQEAQQLDDINKKYADAIKAAGKNKDLIAQLTAARLEEIAALAKQVKAQYLTPYLGGKYAGSRTDAAKTLADEDAAQKDLLATHVKLGIAAWQINAAFREMHRVLGLQVAADLGIQSAALSLQYQDIGQKVSFLKDHMAELGMTIPQLNSALQELSDSTELGIFGKVSQYITDEKTLAQYKEMQYELDVARAKTEVQLAYASGAITLAAYNRIAGIVWSLPDTMPTNGASTAFQAAAAQQSAAQTQLQAAQANQAAADKLTQWGQSLLTNPATSPLAPREQVKQSAADLQATYALAAGGDAAARDRFASQAGDYLALYSSIFGKTGDYAKDVLMLKAEADRLGLGLKGNPAQNVAVGPWPSANQGTVYHDATGELPGSPAGDHTPPPPPPQATTQKVADPDVADRLDKVKDALSAKGDLYKLAQQAGTDSAKYYAQSVPLYQEMCRRLKSLEDEAAATRSYLQRLLAEKKAA